MATQDDPDSERRTSLLDQLAAVQERQVRLHHALTSLVSEELAVSRYLVAANSAGASQEVTVMISLAVIEFRQRGAAITRELKETHEEIQHLLEELRALRINKP